MQSSLARRAALALALAAGSAAVHAQDAIKIVGVYELSGAGASAGTYFKDGVELAVKEINAAGGILGKKIVSTVADTQTNPGVAKGLAAKACRRRCLRGVRPGVLRLDHGQHGRDAPRRDPQLHRRRGGRDHEAGQPLRVPHQRSARPARFPRWPSTSRA
jgi:hypothetical protein